MAFSQNLGDILFENGWSLGKLSEYIGPETQTRLVRDTGYDDTEFRQKMCLEALKAAQVISENEYVTSLQKNMMPSLEYADPSIMPAPQIEAILPNGKTVTLGEKASEPKTPRI
ncbi:hypothetical protein [Marinobacter shengliensis]|uniref:hypothetical protein n=1 Tax=Marinobacter shengliensis TaxID=1389223 RepID=UPI0011094B1B|nr:hypothetical protein [Marinobacter shengliensis]